MFLFSARRDCSDTWRTWRRLKKQERIQAPICAGICPATGVIWTNSTSCKTKAHGKRFPHLLGICLEERDADLDHHRSR